MNMRVVLVIIAVLVLALAAVIVFRQSPDLRNPSTEKLDEKLAPLYVPVLERVELDPAAPSSTDFIRAEPILQNPKLQFVKYRFEWFVNNTQVENPSEGLLDKSLYRKGDSVYCRVTPLRGSFKGPAAESGKVKVGNGAPIVELEPVSTFNVPGEFAYTIVAHDPDNDRLTYRLLSPQGVGIQVNAETGALRWYIASIPAQAANRLPARPEDEGKSGRSSASEPDAETTSAPKSPVIRIAFEVSDPDGAVAEGAITIDLKSGGEIAF